MIEVERLRFRYPGGEEALRLDHFALARRDHALVIGPSGCGKTTLLHLVAGMLAPTQGQVVIDEQDLAALSPRARDRFRGRTIGVVLQQFHLLPSLTALQNLLVAQSIAGLTANPAAAVDMLEALGVAARRGAYPHQLSAGQQQRVAIARALVNRPKLVLADEPTSSLDDDACIAVADLLLEATRRYGASLLIATHDARLKSRVERQLLLPRTPALRAA
jgi:putative ABC transport system ATP-binding protein